MQLIFSYLVRPLHTTNCVHTGASFFKRPYSYILHRPASSSMKEMLGRLISKTTTKTRPRTRWYRSQLPEHRQNEPRFSHEENAEHSQEQMSFQGMPVTCSTRIQFPPYSVIIEFFVSLRLYNSHQLVSSNIFSYVLFKCIFYLNLKIENGKNVLTSIYFILCYSTSQIISSSYKRPHKSPVL